MKRTQGESIYNVGQFYLRVNTTQNVLKCITDDSLVLIFLYYKFKWRIVNNTNNIIIYLENVQILLSRLPATDAVVKRTEVLSAGDKRRQRTVRDW